MGSAVSSAGSYRDRVVKEKPVSQLPWFHLSGQIPFSAWDRQSPPLLRIGTGWSRKIGQLRWFLIRGSSAGHHLRVGLWFEWAQAQVP
ncbi:hypothetical protein AVEN_39783-1 [Araneus ventricosus]|uniref:Uncharacterized protein n=1 Tax=Araneus ventricosus TaxID=182803 RepID=A0A4Y2MH93_ARAVE|nr:hypothetical protein AVEN_39783-1 [Araneus ventricosus]